MTASNQQRLLETGIHGSRYCLRSSVTSRYRYSRQQTLLETGIHGQQILLDIKCNQQILLETKGDYWIRLVSASDNRLLVS